MYHTQKNRVSISYATANVDHSASLGCKVLEWKRCGKTWTEECAMTGGQTHYNKTIMLVFEWLGQHCTEMSE